MSKRDIRCGSGGLATGSGRVVARPEAARPGPRATASPGPVRARVRPRRGLPVTPVVRVSVPPAPPPGRFRPRSAMMDKGSAAGRRPLGLPTRPDVPTQVRESVCDF
ncbi:hypothetical protein GCM10012287_02650 [Streptomyces daqingensis]|uniref:Uncharacterized protein n=1 Tax=Streptomyces daqingensis TaxID=1472640 RepID=A0ABQ2LRD8_9ACTN|nr:hypothetical protein GCM10012287_02650 [Streptomyces daqingensis]